MGNYDESKLTKLGALKQFAERVKKDYATKKELETANASYATKEEVKAQISSTYKPGGSYEFSSLPEAIETNVGMVYNVTDEFTTTSSFLEGEGKKHPAGTNVVVINDSETYKYDVLAGFIDLSGYVAKVPGKDLSSNDYTNEDKEKLAGLQTYTDASQEQHGLMSTTDKKKLDGIDFASDEEVTAMLDEAFGESA